MRLKHVARVQAGNRTFQLRSLDEGDVTEAWVGWFRDEQTRRFIAAARKECTVDTQRAYVRQVCESPRDLLLGLIDDAGTLCATSGVQGVGAAYPQGPWMGCLVDPSRRGQGVGKLLVSSVRDLLARECASKHVYAGIDRDNPTSVALFTACGFTPRPPRPDGSLVMGWSAS